MTLEENLLVEVGLCNAEKENKKRSKNITMKNTAYNALV